MNSRAMIKNRISNVVKTVKHIEISQSDSIHDDYEIKEDNISYNLTYTDSIIELSIDNSEEILHHLGRTNHLIDLYTSAPSFLMVLRYNKR